MSGTEPVMLTGDTDVLQPAEAICRDLGFTLDEAVNGFLRPSIRAGGFPVDLDPNADTPSLKSE